MKGNMSPLSFAKAQVIDFLRESRANVGHLLNVKGLYHSRVLHWNPAQKDALEPAVQKLIEEGMLRGAGDKIELTSEGLKQLYPGDPIPQACRMIMESFEKYGVRVGGRLNTKAFVMEMKTKWTPPQEHALDAAMKSLEVDGLIDCNNGDPILTRAGYDSIYCP